MSTKRVSLPGIDYFQLLIDHHIKRKGGHGHEARLALFMKGPADENLIKKTIRESELCNRLAKVRVSKTFGLGFPSLRFINAESKLIPRFHHAATDEIPRHLLNQPVHVYTNPPLTIDVIQFPNGTSCVLFGFHHILFDFAGVQSFIYSLAGIHTPPLLPANKTKRKFSKRFAGFFREVFFTFREANTLMTIPRKRLPGQKPLQITYREISYSHNETACIYDLCRQRGLDLHHSIYFLDKISLVLHHHLFKKQDKHNFLWIPVPVNTRKRGEPAAVLFNGLSFLFYKIRASDLNCGVSVAPLLKKQTLDQLRNDMPNAFVDFTEGYKYMPMPFYYPMLNLPSFGKLSSFSFSLLGNTFEKLTHFTGNEITGIKNYPSNPVSPGITFLIYEYRGRLHIMTSWVTGQYSVPEQDEVLSALQSSLLV